MKDFKVFDLRFDDGMPKSPRKQIFRSFQVNYRDLRNSARLPSSGQYGVWHRDSHKNSPTIGGGTQDTDFNKGIIGRIFTKFLRRRNGGCQGDPGPLVGILRGHLGGCSELCTMADGKALQGLQ